LLLRPLAWRVSRAVSFITNSLGNGVYRHGCLQQLMAQPCGRIVVLHLAIMGGGFLVMALLSPVVGLLLLAALKIGFDLRGHFSERNKFAEPAGIKAD
jgi:hypothetical protein